MLVCVYLHFTFFYVSVCQPGFRGTLGFREWLPGVPPKQTEIAWNEIRNHSAMRLRECPLLYKARISDFFRYSG